MTALLRTLRDRYRVTAGPLRTQRRIELAVVVLAALLLLQLAYGTLRVTTLGPPAAVAPVSGSLRVPEVTGTGSVSDQERDAIEARPLFWSSRRPGEPGVEPVTETKRSGELDGVRIVGVFADGKTEGVIALVRDSKRRILLGEELDGWTLKAVRPTEADFANGPRRETIRLQRDLGAASVADSGTTGSAEAAPHGASSRATRHRTSNRAARESGAGRPARTARPSRRGNHSAGVPAPAAAAGSSGSGSLSLGVKPGGWMRSARTGAGQQSAGGAEKDADNDK